MADAARPALAACVGVLVLAAGVGALAAWTPAGGADAPGDRAADEPYHRAHAVGVTGGNVTVGVVDVTGFDADHPALDGRVAAARSFGPAASATDGRRSAHGTAAAAVVARVAPDADLYLASFESPAGYRDAVEWLVAEDVDVIVAPVSFFGKPGDGSAPVARVATRAVRRGVVFVAPTGNLARGHWTGRYGRVEDGTLRFGRSERNYLHGDADTLSVWLSWDRAHRGEDYEVRVYRADAGGPRLVARSRPYAGDDLPNERVTADVDPDGTYYVTVHGPPNATGARLRLESPTHDLQHRRADGSVVAPATAPGVVAVGAYDSGGERVAPYSGRGPTSDGRLGVDVVAPARPEVAGADGFAGSSAAAPYAAGVATLVLDADPGLSPREVEHRLERTAADAGSPGVDVAAGYGRVRAWHAVRDARNVTQSGL